MGIIVTLHRVSNSGFNGPATRVFDTATTWDFVDDRDHKTLLIMAKDSGGDGCGRCDHCDVVVIAEFPSDNVESVEDV